MRRGPGGAALPGAQGRGGPGVAPESLSPPLSRWGPRGHRSARGPSRQSLAGPPGQLLWLRPPPGRAAHGPLVALALTLYWGRNPPAFSPPIPTARRSPGPPSPAGPQTPSWAGPGLVSASRARPRRGRAAPSAGPSGRTPAEVCRPFASKSTRGRRGQRPGAPLPRRSQTNNFHLGCGQRESPIGSSP